MTTPIPLAKTWPVLRLDAIASIERNSIQAGKILSGTKYAGLEHILSDEGEINSIAVQIGDIASNKFVYDEGHILYGKLRPYLRKIAIPKEAGVCSTDILPIRPGERLDKSFLYHYLRLPQCVEYATTRSSGANLPRLSPKELAAFPTPLPPLSEQKRIAAILDKADAIRRKRKAALNMADEFLRATFLDMFGDPVTNPKGWDVRPLETIADVNRGKFTPRPRNDPQYYGGDIPFIQTGDVVNADTYVTTHTQTLNEKGLKVSRMFPSGSLAMTIAANIGETAILSYPMCFPDSVVGITPHKKGTALFLDYVLRYHKRYLLSQATETAQKNINLQNIRPLQIIQPSEGTRDKFISTALAVMKHKKNLESEEADILFASLSQRAFRGEL